MVEISLELVIHEVLGEVACLAYALLFVHADIRFFMRQPFTSTRMLFMVKSCTRRRHVRRFWPGSIRGSARRNGGHALYLSERGGYSLRWQSDRDGSFNRGLNFQRERLSSLNGELNLKLEM